MILHIRNPVIFSLALGLIGWSMPPHAGAKTLKLDGAEGQRGSNLCWAASSVTAIRMLRSPTELAADAPIVTQEKLATWRMLIIEDGVRTDAQGNEIDMERLTSEQVEHFPPDKLATRKSQCEGSIGLCNRVSTPILLDLQFDSTDEGEALNWSNIVEQIDSGRPVVFGWTSRDKPAGRDLGLHFSLVTGYRTRDHVRQVRLWDPWPVSPSGRGRKHSRWIPYCTYRNPESVMGEEASHQFDRYNLTRVSGGAPSQPQRSSPKSITPDEDCPSGSAGAADPEPTSGAPMSIRAVQDAFRDEDRIRETLDGSAIPRRALLKSLGAGLPIVSVTVGQLTRAEGNADTLLVDRASSVLIPVTRGRSTIDSFLVLRNRDRGWAPGGYSNTEAAALLVAERRRQPRGDYYLVSVPSLNAFFLARGLGAEASLIPIWDDPQIGATAGEARKAGFFFGRMLDELRERERGPG
jgi:hypothetical protein